MRHQGQRAGTLIRVTASGLGVAGGLLIGVVMAFIGFIQSSQLLRLIVLQWQGKCDYLPCASDATYFSFALFVLMTLLGAGIVAGFLLLLVFRDSSSN